MWGVRGCGGREDVRGTQPLGSRPNGVRGCGQPTCDRRGTHYPKARTMSDNCRKCHGERVTRDEFLAERVDIWKTAAALIKELGNDAPPDPEHVLALCEFLSGDNSL